MEKREVTLKDMAFFLNPRRLDLSMHCPKIFEAIQNDLVADKFRVFEFPYISDSTIVLGGNNTIICGNVNIGFRNVIMESCRIRADGMPIEIGVGNNFQDGVTIHVSRTRKAGAKFGNHNSLTHNVTWHGATADDFVFVAFGSTINDGAYLPDKCFVNTNSNIEANTRLFTGMQYDGRITDGSQHNGKRSSEIVLTNVITGDSRPLGDITSKYSQGQFRGAENRRMTYANDLGILNLENGMPIPALGYYYHTTISSFIHNAKRGGQILIQDQAKDDESVKLAKDLFNLSEAFSRIMTGSHNFTPAMEMAWKNQKIVTDLFCTKISKFYTGNENALDNFDIRIGVDITNAGYNEGLVAVTKRNIEVAANNVPDIIGLKERVAARSGFNRDKFKNSEHEGRV